MNVSRMKIAMDNELAAAGATDEQIARYGALWNGSAEKSSRDGNCLGRCAFSRAMQAI
ncbi:MAG: hypothetical protein JWR80_6403 [Bradyrhizobium sp.]|nr:hypothetical protein [Bradyrhizobium sp.]